MAFASSFVPTFSRGINAINSGGLSSNTRSPARVATKAIADDPSKVRSSKKNAGSNNNMLSSYEQLSALTTIVEDTGDIATIRAHQPFAATTNPSLVYAAADMPEYSALVAEAVRYAKGKASTSTATRLAIARNKLFVEFGAQILSCVSPRGDVSTEVDARLSFDVEAQVITARDIISMYEELGVEKERVLIKLAATWEGIEACRILEAEGIKTNMTLLFGMPQAIAAAEAGAYLISPFVGRILDWHKAAGSYDINNSNAEDPGVTSVKGIYDYYKTHGHDTIVMGASFRNLDEILALAGCDRLTIAPKYIQTLKESTQQIERKLSIDSIVNPPPKLNIDEKSFRWLLNEDPMATEKLAEGIRKFAVDLVKLDNKLEKLIL